MAGAKTRLIIGSALLGIPVDGWATTYARSDVPPSISTGHVVIDPISRIWTTQEINRVVNTCLTVVNKTGKINLKTLSKLGWIRFYTGEVQSPSGPVRHIEFINKDLFISVENFSRADACNVTARIRDDEHYNQIIQQFPSSLGTEYFNLHLGHKTFKAKSLSQLGNSASEEIQFKKSAVLVLQKLWIDGRSVMNVKVFYAAD